MKILFDENLSPALVVGLAAEYPGSTHVREVGLRGATDSQIWEYARTEGFVIASKDTDFRERSFLEGFPPKLKFRHTPPSADWSFPGGGG